MEDLLALEFIHGRNISDYATAAPVIETFGFDLGEFRAVFDSELMAEATRANFDLAAEIADGYPTSATAFRTWSGRGSHSNAMTVSSRTNTASGQHQAGPATPGVLVRDGRPRGRTSLRGADVGERVCRRRSSLGRAARRCGTLVQTARGGWSGRRRRVRIPGWVPEMDHRGRGVRADRLLIRPAGTRRESSTTPGGRSPSRRLARHAAPPEISTYGARSWRWR